MYKICVVSHELQYGKRLEDYWTAHGLSQIKVETVSDFEKIKEDSVYDLFLCEEEQTREQWNGKLVVTLVSDFNKEQAQNKLAKYQRPQDVYEKLLHLCEKREDTIQQMIALEKAVDGKEQILIYEKEPGATDSYAVGILENCPMEGLIPLHKKNQEEGKIKYYIHGKLTLREFLLSRGTDRQLLQILKDIFDVLIRIEDYMLDRNQLVLQMDYIYLHQLTGKPSLIYIPEVNKTKQSWIAGYQELMTQVSEIMKNHVAQEASYMIPLTGTKAEPVQIREPLQYNQRTEFFPDMQKTSIEHTVSFSEQKPRLFWKKNQKQIVIDRKIFKIGKEKKFVDLWISDNPAVSRNHADLVYQGNQMYLIDKESLNFTYINGKKIPANVKTLLHDKDCIRLANEEFIYLEA